MQKLSFLLCILAASCTVPAQGQQGAWGNLNTLRPGEQIQVRTIKAAKVSGAFLNITDAAISVQAEAGPQTIQRQDVRSVKRARGKHRLRNTLILAGVGAGVGAGIGAATHHSCPSTQSFCFDVGGRSLPAGLGAVAGLLGGAVIGALLPSHETIYSVSSH
jgi:hypothetical protein